MASLLDQLRERRTQAREATAQIEQRAAEEQRDLTPEELTEHGQHLTAEREAGDQLDQLRDDQIAELRATAARRPGPVPARGPVLTREQNVTDWAQTRGLFEPGAEDRPPSFDRYLRGIVSGNWDGAAQERAMSEGTLTAGGHLVPTPLSSRVIDLAATRCR